MFDGRNTRPDPIGSAQFTYDYLGRRVGKLLSNRNSGDTAWLPDAAHNLKFLYSGWNLIAEIDAGTGAITKNVFWGLDLSGSGDGAGGVGGLLMVQEASNTYLPAYDAMGNVHGMIKASDGSLAAAYEYDAFGNTLRESGAYAASNPFRFATKYADLETGLVQYNTRYYSPSLGRFINRDTISEQGGLNLYAYCGNNGVNRWDLLGNISQDYYFQNNASDANMWYASGMVLDTGNVVVGIPMSTTSNSTFLLTYSDGSTERVSAPNAAAARTQSSSGPTSSGSPIFSGTDLGGDPEALRLDPLVVKASDSSYAGDPTSSPFGSRGPNSTDIGATSARLADGTTARGGVFQPVDLTKIATGPNGIILGAVTTTYTLQDGTISSESRTEAWIVKDGKVYKDISATTLSGGVDRYIVGGYNPQYPKQVSWTGNMQFIPDATLGLGWNSSSSPSDLSQGTLYQSGLLFSLTGPGLQRQFTIVNNQSQHRWDVTSSTVISVPLPSDKH